MDTTTDRSALEGKLIPELQQIAQRLGIEGSQKLRKAGLIDAIVEHGPAATHRRTGRPPRRTRRTAATAVPSGEPASDERAPSRDGGSNGQRTPPRRPSDEGERDAGNDRPRGGHGPDRSSARRTRSRATVSPATARRATGRATTGPQGDRQGGDRSQGGRPQGIARRVTARVATARRATVRAATSRVDGPTAATTEATERAATAVGVPHARSAGGSARSAGSARSRSAPRSSRTRRS